MGSIQPTLKSLDGLPPAVADIYRKADDGNGYVLNIDGSQGYSIEKIQPLREALTAERENLRTAVQHLRKFGYTIGESGKLSAVGDDAIDPDFARDAISKIKSGKFDGKKMEPDELAEMRKQFETKFAADRETFEKERAEYDRYLNEQLIDREAIAHIKSLGGTEETVARLMPTIKLRARVKKDKGQPVVVVTDDHGREVLSKQTGSAEPMGLREHIQRLHTDRIWAVAWPSKAAGGSGADHPTGGSGLGGAPKDPSQMTGRQLLQQAWGQTAT